MTWYDNLKSHPRTFEVQERALTEGKGYATQLELYTKMVEHACRLEDELREIQAQLKEISLDLLDAMSEPVNHSAP